MTINTAFSNNFGFLGETVSPSAVTELGGSSRGIYSRGASRGASRGGAAGGAFLSPLSSPMRPPGTVASHMVVPSALASSSPSRSHSQSQSQRLTIEVSSPSSHNSRHFQDVSVRELSPASTALTSPEHSNISLFSPATGLTRGKALERQSLVSPGKLGAVGWASASEKRLISPSPSPSPSLSQTDSHTGMTVQRSNTANTDTMRIPATSTPISVSAVSATSIRP